jgi:DNA-binding FadR family transcriptional regulator
MQRLKPIDARSIQQQIQERVKEFILSNRLQPDDPLPTESQLVDQLHVSRAALREALTSLESLGVIRSIRGKGRYVNKFNLGPVVQNLGYSMLFDLEDLVEILAVRERLEVGFVAEAIAALDAEAMGQLHTLLESMRQKARAGMSFLDEDFSFHRAIYAGLGNRLLMKLLDVFWHTYKNLRDQSLQGAGDPEVEIRNHELILEALEARDVELVQRRIVDHYATLKEQLKTAQLRKRSQAHLCCASESTAHEEI